ncbi:MAG TPA: glycoside hydrolase family 125 protein [Bacillota bacterium]
MQDSIAYTVTANEYVAIPDIDRETAAVYSANVLHMAARGLVEFRGDPLYRPVLELGGAEVPLRLGPAHLVDDFVPRWVGEHGLLTLTISYCAPPGCKGWAVALELANAGPEPVEAGLGLAGRWTQVARSIFSGRAIQGMQRVYWDGWTHALIWEAGTGVPLAALALRQEDGARPGVRSEAPHASRGDPDPHPDPNLVDPPVPPPVDYRLLTRVRVEPGGTARAVFYWGAAVEGDGAGLMTVDLARHGWEDLFAATRAWLGERARGGGPRARVGEPQAAAPMPRGGEEAPAHPLGHAGRGEGSTDPADALLRVRNRNLFFCLHFAAGRTIDTEELVLVTSRSPRYYVSAAHWSRDSLLWAFPAVLAADPRLARDWLLAAFERYARNAGVHALYLDGSILYPGFELDELCAFFIALGRYLDGTGDAGILDEPAVSRVVPRLAAELQKRRDPATGLAQTFLLSSDDPAHYPYVTYSNALAWKAYRVLAEIRRRRGRGDGSRTAGAEAEAERIRAAIRRHCVVEGPFGPMFCGSTDLRGNHVLYDEPPGSLELLVYYGFTTGDDPVYRNTVRWIHSANNPHGPGVGPYATPTCPHARHAWTLAVANALLAGNDAWLERLPALPLDGGFACETFDAATGVVRTGPAFATCAGFLVHAIDTALDRRRGR